MLALPETLEFLGITPQSKKPKRTEPSVRLQLVDLPALEASAITRLTECLGIPENQLVKLAGISERTYQRRKARHETFKGHEADGVLRIARIASEATQVFGDEERARHWLSAPSAILDNQTPLDLLQSDAGAQLVEEELGRIHYGEYA